MLKLAWIWIFIAIVVINSATAQNDGDVDVTKHPYVVSIRKNGRHVCSGAILDQYNIITSDRCVPSFEHVWNIMNDVTVVSGTSTLKPGGYRTFVKEMFSQNHYFNPTKNPVISGLGMVKLLFPLKYGDKVQPIELSATEVPSDAKLQTIGWMIANRNGRKTSHLKEVTLEVVNREECQGFHKKNLTDFEFCTKPILKIDFCEGDSGSPLIYKGKLVGLTTYGMSCKDIPVPDVHTSIDKMHEYINKIIDG